MSGLDVARVLKAASDTKAIPIAATTALAMPVMSALFARVAVRDIWRSQYA